MLFDRKLVGAAAAVSGALASSPRARRASSAIARHPALVRAAFGLIAIFCDIAAILVSAVLAGEVYHRLMYDVAAELDLLLRGGFVISVLFVAPNLARGEYTVSRYLAFKGHSELVFMLWNVAFVSALALAFVTKTTADFSRGSALFFYIAGAVNISLVRLLLVRVVRDRATGGVAARRIFLVGAEADLEAFSERYRPWDLGMRVVSSAVLRGPESLQDDLALAAASARVLRPEDVFVLAPWSQKETIEACVNAFLRVPASIHLGPERVLDRFSDLEVERIGPINSLHLVRRPLSTIEIIAKRAFDTVVGACALVLLAPLFALMAILIKLDSPGPVFFLQRRYGFNQEPFHIFKFRSMTTMDDGAVVRQATKGDLRITRVGRFMRRFNIDEVPQLFNVLRGEMSLVGPRPHALAHDQFYERTIAMYARRHNVRPGITGWAQVNGYRGETNTEDKMRARVEHDLYYIDHWSLLLDIRILVLTIFSRKAYRNAH